MVVLIWQFTSAWNDYLFAAFFSSGRNGPVTLALNFLAGGQLTDYAVSMAGALIASRPDAASSTSCSGKYFIGGLWRLGQGLTAVEPKERGGAGLIWPAPPRI